MNTAVGNVLFFCIKHALPGQTKKIHSDPLEKFRYFNRKGLFPGMAFRRCVRSPGMEEAGAPGQDQYWETLLMISFMISVVPPPMLRMRESR